ncbi:hypothetical protein KM043_011921 [Ampulex compressa]|nr:hypothetical protein KM043_011921 [Ampulex compressa]
MTEGCSRRGAVGCADADDRLRSGGRIASRIVWDGRRRSGVAPAWSPATHARPPFSAKKGALRHPLRPPFHLPSPPSWGALWPEKEGGPSDGRALGRA